MKALGSFLLGGVILLKALGWIAWPWWIILCPLYLPLLGIIVFLGGVTLISFYIEVRNKKQKE